MHERQSKNDPRRSLFRRSFYRFWQVFWQFVVLLLFQVRVHHQRRFPDHGASLICANHQSNLDPIVIGCASPRRINYLAKKSLFRTRIGNWVMRMVESIPIDREGVGIAGIKETLKRLKKKEPVVMFPEGQRTFDGEMTPLMSGICVLIKRVPTDVIPVGIEGAFDCWPRQNPWPRPGQIHVVVGEPIPYELMKDLSDDALLALLEERISACFQEARQRYRKSRRFLPESVCSVSRRKGIN